MGDWGPMLGIINALMRQALRGKATRIAVNLEHCEDMARIEVTDNGTGADQDELAIMLTKLNQPRREELAEYYGMLAGRSVGDSLSIVGMMTDHVDVHSAVGRGTEVCVHMRLK